MLSWESLFIVRQFWAHVSVVRVCASSRSHLLYTKKDVAECQVRTMYIVIVFLLTHSIQYFRCTDITSNALTQSTHPSLKIVWYRPYNLEAESGLPAWQTWCLCIVHTYKMSGCLFSRVHFSYMVECGVLRLNASESMQPQTELSIHFISTIPQIHINAAQQNQREKKNDKLKLYQQKFFETQHTVKG